MHAPMPVAWLLTALCGATGLYCLLRVPRLPKAAPASRRATALEGAMALGMAFMAVPFAQSTPPAWFAVYFTVTAVCSLALLRAGVPHQRHHLVEAAAMVYMAVAMATGPSQHGGGLSPLTGLLLVHFAVDALRAAPRLVAAPVAATGPLRQHHLERLPEINAVCRLTMALAMFAMLATL